MRILRPESAPSWFISHGAPNTVLMEDAFAARLKQLGASLSFDPEAAVVLSAHSVSFNDSVQVWADEEADLEYDFRGFQEELYQYSYPAQGSRSWSQQVLALLKAAGISSEPVHGRRWDHGVWAPLSMIFPNAQVPVVQIALPSDAPPTLFLRVGQALAPLRQSGVLLLGSGGAVHNLREMEWAAKNAAPAAWSSEFEKWVLDTLGRGAITDLAEFEDHAPHAGRAHPTHEHYLPLLFAVGGTLQGDQLKTLHRGFQYRTLSLLCLEFSDAQQLGQESRKDLPH